MHDCTIGSQLKEKDNHFSRPFIDTRAGRVAKLPFMGAWAGYPTHLDHVKPMVIEICLRLLGQLGNAAVVESNKTEAGAREQALKQLKADQGRVPSILTGWTAGSRRPALSRSRNSGEQQKQVEARMTDTQLRSAWRLCR